MKNFKKALAAACSLVLAFALVVPCVSTALADEETQQQTNTLQLRVTYNNKPIVLGTFDKVPHTVSTTFSLGVTYPGFEAVGKTTSFKLADNLQTLRVSQVDEAASSTYTVIVSNGNGVLPMTDGTYLDLGEVSFNIDADIEAGSNEAAMRGAFINITSLQTAGANLVTTTLVGPGSDKNELKEAIVLSNASFKNGSNSDAGGSTTPPPGAPSDSDLSDAIVPKHETPTFNVDTGINPPSEAAIEAGANPVAIAALNALYKGEMPEGINKDDFEPLRLFIAEVIAAGYKLEDLTLTYAVDSLKYTYDTDVPEGDRLILENIVEANKDKIDTLVGYYNLGISMVVSVPEEAPAGADPAMLNNTSVKAALDYTKEPVDFSVDVPKDSLKGKEAAVCYVHNNEGKILDNEIIVDEVANKVTFKATEFSTYSVYSCKKGAVLKYPEDDGKTTSGANNTTAAKADAQGGGINPVVIVLIIVLVLAAAGGGYFFIMQKRKNS